MDDRKIAIVTGGSSGLGLAIAAKFIENNILTVITGRSREKLNEAAESLGNLCVPGVLDMNDLDAIPEFIQKTKEEYGRLDILVNNAGINQKKDFLEVSDEDFQHVMLINLVSVFSITREAAKIMTQQEKGCIVNISSMAAQYGIPKVIAYTAAKTAVEGMTRAMAVELGKYKIRVNCIAPGFIKTKMSATALESDPERKAKVLSRTPLGELGLPEDVANTVYFLVSDEAKYITGAVVPVDGGNAIGF